jgi:site-specific recombinase XerD
VQQATDPQYDADLVQALQDPKVRGILERVSQGVEQTAAQFQQELANAALTATASFMSAFPELNGLSAEQLPGAVALIAKNDPVRAQAIAHHYRQVSHLVAQHQRVAVQQQEQQQTRAAEQFRAYAAAHDAVSLRGESPESVKAIQSVILEDAKRAGISEKEIAQVYNSVPAFRHSFVQDLLADGAKYRLAQRNISRAVSRPIPNVQRPGSPALMQTRTEAALAEAQAKLKPSMNPREAADYLIARRGAKR